MREAEDFVQRTRASHDCAIDAQLDLATAENEWMNEELLKKLASRPGMLKRFEGGLVRQFG